MHWIDSLEYELEWQIREIILDYGRPLAVDDPRVQRLFDNLAAVRRLKEELLNEQGQQQSAR